MSAHVPPIKDLSYYNVPVGYPNPPDPPPCRIAGESVDFNFLPKVSKAIFKVLFKSKKSNDDYPTFGSDL